MSLTLLDWRRRIARLYAEVRAEPDIVAAHDHWRRTRDDLLRAHPDSPIPEPARLILDFNFAYNPSCAYDLAWACPLAPAGNKLAWPLVAGELMPSPQAGQASAPAGPLTSPAPRFPC